MKTDIVTKRDMSTRGEKQELGKLPVDKRKVASPKQPAAPKKKFRMTADGTLKEKRSFKKFANKRSRNSK